MIDSVQLRLADSVIDGKRRRLPQKVDPEYATNDYERQLLNLVPAMVVEVDILGRCMVANIGHKMPAGGQLALESC
jgi:hypothetical protein